MDLINLEYAFSGWNVPLTTAGESKPEETQVHLSILNPSITKEIHTRIKGWKCKKQTAISHSSAEAEVISLDAGLKMEGRYESMITKGRNPALSHVPCTRRVDLGILTKGSITTALWQQQLNLWLLAPLSQMPLEKAGDTTTRTKSQTSVQKDVGCWETLASLRTWHTYRGNLGQVTGKQFSTRTHPGNHRDYHRCHI